MSGSFLKPVFFATAVLFGAGIAVLPPPGSGPELLAASGAMPCFFFGGAFLICGLFTLKNPSQGQVGTFGVAALAVFMASAGFFRTENPWPLVALLLVSFPLALALFLRWKKSRIRRVGD